MATALSAFAPRKQASKIDDRRWRTLCARDKLADGTFIVAVRTTGIFCRPSCSSRRPNRENVRFFETWQDAEAAGFRACKRCHPREMKQPLPAAIARACELLQESETPLSLTELAAAVGQSPFHLQREFKKHVGLSPKQFAVARRAERFRDSLQVGSTKTVTAAALAAGFNSSSRAYEQSGNKLGMTPRAWQRGGAGETIYRAIAPCDLGFVLVATTERGVCAIQLGDLERELRASLAELFPRATIVEADERFGDRLQAVVDFIHTPSAGLELPLDLQGTAFQHRVWQALQEIPPGVTKTYAQLAAEIGRPTATRAVGAACGANPVALAVPCHRVVGSSGALTGYRWGVERKRELLARETKSGRKEK